MTTEDPKGFFSPFFNEYKSLGFYSKLLGTILQYARAVDSSGRNLQRLVWKEICQFSGRHFSREDDDDGMAETETLGKLEGFISGLLRLPRFAQHARTRSVPFFFTLTQTSYPDAQREPREPRDRL